MQSLTVTARVDNAFTVRASGRFESEVAPLIEAAPELLAALRAMLARHNDRDALGDLWPAEARAARAAIARATGQA